MNDIKNEWMQAQGILNRKFEILKKMKQNVKFLKNKKKYYKMII